MQRAISPEQEPEVIELYKQVGNCRKVAERFGVSDETVRRILMSNSVPRKKQKRDKPKSENPINKHKGIDSEQVRELYQSGMSISGIARELGCSDNTIYHHLEKLGLYKIGDRKSKNDAFVPQILELHHQGMSDYQIADATGISRYVINDRLRRAGISRGRGKPTPATLVCPRCGKSFTKRSSNQVYCSHTCSNAVYWLRRNDAKRTGDDGEVETITLREVWEHDKGRCYICGCKTDWNDYRIVNGWRVTGPRYPSRDHVIALSNGGTHTRDNIRLACFECNTKKNNLGQMRLPIAV